MRYAVTVAPELIEQWVRDGAEIPACRCTIGLPADARLTGVGFDRAMSGCREVTLYFDTPDDPREARNFTPTYQRIEPARTSLLMEGLRFHQRFGPRPE